MLGSAVAIGDRRGDAVVVLPKGGQLLAGPDPSRTAGFGVLPQQPVEPNLRQVRELSRARLGVPRRVRPASPGWDLAELEAVQRCRAGDRGVPDHLAPPVVGRGLCVDVVRHADLVEDLHRPDVEQVRARVPRVRPAPVDEQHLDSLPGQQHRRREPDGSAATIRTGTSRGHSSCASADSGAGRRTAG